MKTALINTLLAACLASPLAAGTAVAAEPWPDKAVGIHEMQPLTPMRLRVPSSHPDKKVRRAAVVRAHVSAEGDVRRVMLIDSCGSPVHDEAALRALSVMRFKPYLADDAPAAVSLLVAFYRPLAGPP